MKASPIFSFILLCLACDTGHAGSRTSTSYAVGADSTDAGGRRAVSVSYTNDGTVGGVVGVSSVAAPVETVKAGYIGQLYEVTGLQIAALPPSVNEGSTRQLSAMQLLDDSTTLAVDANSITWSVMAGPFSGISASGLASAAIVYQDTVATAQGSYGGLAGTLDVTVLDSVADNFGNYAGDGLPDGWQVQYLGVNGSSGGPLLDPDFDGIPNLLEYSLNLNPVLHSALPASTMLNGGTLEYTYTRRKSAVVGGTLFQVEWSDTLEALSWSDDDVTEEILSDNGSEQQVKASLPAGSSGRRFVRLRVQ